MTPDNTHTLTAHIELIKALLLRSENNCNTRSHVRKKRVENVVRVPTATTVASAKTDGGVLRTTHSCSCRVWHVDATYVPLTTRYISSRALRILSGRRPQPQHAAVSHGIQQYCSAARFVPRACYGCREATAGGKEVDNLHMWAILGNSIGSHRR